MTTFAKSGYGQVEPNHLSAQRTGQIYAQLPVAANLLAAGGALATAGGVENGLFMKYDYANGVVDLSGSGEWMLVYNEEKLYESGQTRADWIQASADAVNGVIVPRLFKTNVGDIFTTNMVKDATGYDVGDTLVVGTTGVLELGSGSEGSMIWQIAAITTLPDGKAAVKIVRLPDVAAA